MTDKLKVLDLFSGIGGLSLGLERTGGFETVAFCEIEPFPRRVLAKHWPEVPCYDDVRTLTAERLSADGIAVDIITGGFPCQDISAAGHQRGMGEGTRSGLWSEIVRLIGEIRPKFVIVENVAALLAGPSERPGGWFGRVLGDLAECGYDAEWRNIPAWHVGLPHGRERVWIIAHSPEVRLASQVFKENSASRHAAREAGAYEKCQSICGQVGHAEVVAVSLAGEKAKGSRAYLQGHTYACQPCQEALFGAGVISISVGINPPARAA